LQSAIKFINATVPSSAGRVGMNVRFLQQMGARNSEAVAAGVVNDASETVVQILVVLATLPFVHAHVPPKHLNVHAPHSRLVLAIIAALVIGFAVIFAVPSMRARFLPGIRTGLSSVAGVARTPRKRRELFGGQLGAQLLFALTLGAVCRAYGIH